MRNKKTTPWTLLACAGLFTFYLMSCGDGGTDGKKTGGGTGGSSQDTTSVTLEQHSRYVSPAGTSSTAETTDNAKTVKKKSGKKSDQ